MTLVQLTVNLEKRVKLIRFFPCFAHFSDEQMRELCSLMEEVTVDKNQIIVQENDVVDSIYIIVKGEAEVLREQLFRKKKRKIPVAKLGEGESIGLNDAGFFSQTGTRTATVSSMTSMILLKIALKNLTEFLKKYQLEKKLLDTSDQMLKMLFIKQSLPFSKISPERLIWLAEHVQTMKAPKETILFQQGETGDACYLIRSGKVDIFAKSDGSEKKIAELKAPVLFGEATLITNSPRNATAKTITDCELLVLERQHLTELIETEDRVASMFMTLMIDRSRPLKNNNVSIHKRLTADRQEITILKNKDNDKYFRLSKEGDFIWSQLDGKHTLQEITLDLAKEYKVFAPDMVVAVISKLTKNGFIENVGLTVLTHENKGPLWVRFFTALRRILEMRYAFSKADQILTRIYQKFFKYLFTKPAQIMLWLIILIGMLAFIDQTGPVLNLFRVKHISLLLLILLIPLSIAETFLHELGHAIAVKAFGYEVHYVGIGWYWFGPISFADTSDMWLATRKQRMVVNLAGVYVDLVVAGICGLIIYYISQPYILCILWLFALYTYIGGIRRLSPLQEMDGYYVLMDWVEKNRLQQSAVLWLVKKLPSCIKHPSLFKKYKAEIIFWVVSLCYLALVTGIAFVIQRFVFDVLNIKGNPYLSLIIPFAILCLTSLSIMAQIKNQAEQEK